MFRKTSLLVAAASLALIPVATPEPAHAGGEGVAAGIIGFAAGAIIGSQMNRPRERRVYRAAPQRPRRSAAEREYWMNVQASLNRLGFDAGPVDGAPGRKTRSAVTQFQMSINAVPNGKLTSEQASVLFARVNPGNSMATAPAQPAPYMQPGTMPAYQQQPQQPAYGVPVGGYQGQQGFPPMQQPFPQGGQQQAAFPAPTQGGFPQQGRQAGFPAPAQQPAAAAAGSATFPLVDGAVSGAGAQPADGFPPLAGSNADNNQVPMPASTAPALLQQPEPAAAPGGQAAPSPQAQPIIQTDASGNQFVEINGQRFYMNADPAVPAAPAATPPTAVVVTAETEAELQPQQ